MILIRTLAPLRLDHLRYFSRAGRLPLFSQSVLNLFAKNEEATEGISWFTTSVNNFANACSEVR